MTNRQAKVGSNYSCTARPQIHCSIKTAEVGKTLELLNSSTVLRDSDVQKLFLKKKNVVSQGRAILQHAQHDGRYVYPGSV